MSRSLALPRSVMRPERRRQLLAQQQHVPGGVRFGGETLQYVPADQNLRPLRDQLIVEPLEVVYSRWVYVHANTKPLRGIVLAAGPGHYPSYYLDKHGERLPDHKRGERKERAHGKHFVPTEVKAGDVIELGGAENGGYSFEQFWWGDVLCLHCTERDVAVVVDIPEAEARAQAGISRHAAA